MLTGVDLAHGESSLERCCCRSTGVWYLGCQYLLAFKKADMADTKRTCWWLSWFRSRQTHQQKELTPNHGFIAVEQQKTPLMAELKRRHLLNANRDHQTVKFFLFCNRLTSLSINVSPRSIRILAFNIQRLAPSSMRFPVMLLYARASALTIGSLTPSSPKQ